MSKPQIQNKHSWTRARTHTHTEAGIIKSEVMIIQTQNTSIPQPNLIKASPRPMCLISAIKLLPVLSSYAASRFDRFQLCIPLHQSLSLSRVHVIHFFRNVKRKSKFPLSALNAHSIVSTMVFPCVWWTVFLYVSFFLLGFFVQLCFRKTSVCHQCACLSPDLVPC